MSSQSWKDTPQWKSYQKRIGQVEKMEKMRERLKVYCRACGSFVMLKTPNTIEGLIEKCESCGDSGPHDSYEMGISPMDREAKI